jgi:hypothetical protein
VNNEKFNGLLDENTVAKLLNVSVATLRRWRMLRKGPDFSRVGGHIRYRPSSVEQYITSCSVKCEDGSKSTSNSRARRYYYLAWQKPSGQA